MTLPILLYIGAGTGLAFLGLFAPLPIGVILNSIGLHFFDPYTVLGIGGAFFFFSSIARLIIFRRFVDWEIYKNLLPGSLVGGITIAWLVIYLPTKLLTIILLSMGLFYVAKNLFSLEKKGVSSKTPVSGFLAGLSAGAFSQLGGPGGSLRMAYISNHVESMQALHGNTAAISATLAFFTTLVRVETGQVPLELLWPLAIMLPLQLIISFFGKSILDRLHWSPRSMRLIVNGSVFISLVILLPPLFA